MTSVQCLKNKCYLQHQARDYLEITKNWGVVVLLKFYWAPDIVEFVFGIFWHFNIEIAY